jgi:hypothetical protein
MDHDASFVMPVNASRYCKVLIDPLQSMADGQ